MSPMKGDGEVGGPPLLAVIDMQEFFAAGSPWEVPGFADLIEPIDALASAYGERTIFTRFVIPEVPKGSWVGYYRAWPQVLAPDAARLADLAEPWGSQGLDTLDKTTFSKWGPELESMLGPSRQLTVCGVSTDCCVIATVLAAVDGGAQVRVVADACAGITPEAHEAALNLMGGFAPQVTFGSVEEELSRLAGASRA
jgi:nicotinamidase-related amidase